MFMPCKNPGCLSKSGVFDRHPEEGIFKAAKVSFSKDKKYN
jgi:hypothetical protein